MTRKEMEKRVVKAQEALRPIPPKEEQRAKKMSGYMFAGKSEGWCSVCGEVHTGVWKDGKTVRCPKCGASLKVSHSRKRVANEQYYYQFICVVDGMQCIRTWKVDRRTRRGEGSSAFMGECVRTWISEEGMVVVTARCRAMSFYCDIWRWDTPIALKRKYDEAAYTVWGETNARPRLLERVKRNGLKALDREISPRAQLVAILSNPMAEVVCKSGCRELFRYMLGWGRYEVKREWASVKVALRHHYEPESWSEWFDYVMLLGEHGRDKRNPFYICPPDLKAAHQREIEEEERRERRREEEREREELERIREDGELDTKYKDARRAWLGWKVERGAVTLSVLDSVREFYDEGKEMHHCVFACGYYDTERHPNSLILGARVDGERMETVEVDMGSWKVRQCMGRCNRPSDWHGAIMELVTESIEGLRKIGSNRAMQSIVG